MKDQTISKESKNIATIAYITIVGTFIAIFMNGDNKTEFASFHIRQSLGIFITFFFFSYPVGYFDSGMISGSLYLFIFILWIYGFLGMLQNEKRLIPILGPFFQKFFKNL
jgi:uncharacterized membrane protein